MVGDGGKNGGILGFRRSFYIRISRDGVGARIFFADQVIPNINSVYYPKFFLNISVHVLVKQIVHICIYVLIFEKKSFKISRHILYSLM